MRSIANKRDIVLDNVGIGLVHPESPRPYLDTNSEVSLDLRVELRVRREELFDGKIGTAPGVICVVSGGAGEEAVVGEELAAVARG
jgi:hypothetical protein